MENVDIAGAIADVVAGVEVGVEVGLPAPAPVGPVKKTRAKGAGRPGRPRKNAVEVPIVMQGVVEKPVVDDDLIELVYWRPALFKKLGSLLNIYSVSEVELKFDATGMRIETCNRLNTARIYIHVSGASMNQYYCNTPINLWVNCDHLVKIFNSITPAHSQISFTLKRDNRKTIYIVLEDRTYGNKSLCPIEVLQKEHVVKQAIKDADDDTNYPVKFRLASAHFKRKIGDMLESTDKFTIQMTGVEPLQIPCVSDPKKTAGQKENRVEVYSDRTKIELVSTLALDDVFSASIDIMNIRSMSKQTLGDSVYIAADKKLPMSFLSLIDNHGNGWAASIKIFVNLSTR